MKKTRTKIKKEEIRFFACNICGKEIELEEPKSEFEGRYDPYYQIGDFDFHGDCLQKFLKNKLKCN